MRIYLATLTFTVTGDPDLETIEKMLPRAVGTLAVAGTDGALWRVADCAVHALGEMMPKGQKGRLVSDPVIIQAAAPGRKQ